MQRWSVDAIPDLSGKVAIVTGSNEGYPFDSAYNLHNPTYKNTSIGYETALVLASHGCKIIMACRNQTRAEISKADMLATIRAEGIDIADDDIEIELLDLAKFDSIRDFAIRLKSKYDGISILVNNAGTNARPYATTADGHETIFQTNYLGHFLLTKELFPLLAAEEDARIVTQTSYWHHQGVINLNHLEYDSNNYDYSKAYANSKLAELIFSFELDRRLKTAGLNIKSIATHPGSSKTTMLYRYPTQNIGHFFQKTGEAIVGQSPKEAALIELYACTSPDAEGGSLYGPDGWFELSGNPTRVEPAPSVNNTSLASKLWDETQNILEEVFDVEALYVNRYQMTC